MTVRNNVLETQLGFLDVGLKVCVGGRQGQDNTSVGLNERLTHFFPGHMLTLCTKVTWTLHRIRDISRNADTQKTIAIEKPLKDGSDDYSLTIKKVLRVT